MKLLNLCLISLNIFTFPSVALAEYPSIPNISTQTNLIGQKETETEISQETEPQESVEDSKTAAEPDEAKADRPTPEEMARLKQLATADRLYLSGYKAAAQKLYRQAKEVWDIQREQTAKKDESVSVFDDPAQLSPAGKVFWRNYQQGKKQELETKILSALKLLTTREPQFISGHIHYAQMLQQYERETEATAVLNRAVNLYPRQPKLIEARIENHINQEEWLDASVLARQFALFNPELPEAQKFDRLAEEYLAEYQSDLKSDIALNAVGNLIAGTVGFALTGSLLGPLSALETTSMLLRGESAIGNASVKQAKQQLPLLEDPKVTQYVDELGQKVAAASGRDDFEYEFYIIMDDSLNAFALPGGKIFVHAGAIMKTDTEAELAGLLAHEVSHSALSHGFQLAAQGNFTANIVRHIPYVGNAATGLIVMNYSRGMEKQADIFGTRILVNSGYAADGVRNLMVKLDKAHQDEDNPEPVEWFSSHPNNKNRVRYIEQLVIENNLNRYTYEGVARHQEMKYIIAEKWQKYEKCTEEVVTLEAARKCLQNLDGARESKDNNDDN